jgi:hypothetical protein
MSNPIRSPFSAEAPESDALTQLALDLHWTWNHSADEVWRRLDPELWELTGNPWLILQVVSQQKLDSLSDPILREQVGQLLTEIAEKKASSVWYQTAHPESPLRTVAYFSMEYMLSEALPIYSGGLGNVAGDLDPSAVRVGLYADSLDGGAPFRQEMRLEEERQGDSGARLYSTRTPATRPASDFTPCVVPYHPSALALEIDRILWQR